MKQGYSSNVVLAAAALHRFWKDLKGTLGFRFFVTICFVSLVVLRMSHGGIQPQPESGSAVSGQTGQQIVSCCHHGEQTLHALADDVNQSHALEDHQHCSASCGLCLSVCLPVMPVDLSLLICFEGFVVYSEPLGMISRRIEPPEPPPLRHLA